MRSYVLLLAGVSAGCMAPVNTGTAPVSSGAPMGTLFIVGGGSQTNDLVRKFIDLAGGHNRLRVRAGLTADPTTGRTQADVLAAIGRERRLELAFEGDRWPDLVRTGQAITVLGLTANQTLLPIPQPEIDTAPGITQNPGY